MDTILEKICNCIADINIERIRDLVKKAIEEGTPAYTIITDGLARGLGIVGRKYEEGEYFLSELIAAGYAMNEAMEELAPHLQTGARMKYLGKVVLGTVRGDLHDIGKNIVRMLLTGAGFEVYDLGVDVLPEEFVKRVRETKADIVAMSAMLTTTMPEMKVIIQELVKAGLRNKVKIIIGGAPITDDFARQAGADFAANNAVEGVRVCKAWMEEN
jgi:5-methyltetrahydrofolate--homocysteine methyltransferase